MPASIFSSNGLGDFPELMIKWQASAITGSVVNAGEGMERKHSAAHA